MSDWTSGFFEANTKHGRIKTRASLCNGLAVHPTLDPIVKGRRRILWRISHVRSGKKFPGVYETEKAAIQVAEQLLPLANWKQAEKALKTPELFARSMEAINSKRSTSVTEAKP
jgi:hypothetical protein